MPRPSKSRRLAVWMNGEQVGTWSINAQGQHEFGYEHEWINAVDARPLSLSMPLQPTDTPYRGALVESYFDNLLPNSIDIRRRVQSRFGAASMSAFDLLVEVGRDCVGAVQLLPAGQPPESIKQVIGEPLDENGVAATLRSVVSPVRSGQREEGSFRISIAGAQEKTALLWNEGQWLLPSGATPTTHIFKLPLGRVGNMQADYKWADIQPRHWLATAAVIGVEAGARDDIQQIVERAPTIVDAVTAILPEGFPNSVADPILNGLLNSAKKLAESR
ncbi:MAG: serine/threonine-protein kinase HipA [Gammaproteobacteria bacterium]|jgi:serine/threonine-protein kinase HipA